MSSIRRHKLKNKMAVQALLGEDDIFFGASSQDASTYANLFAEVAKLGGGIAATELAKKEAEKKAAEEKEKNKEADAAQAAAAAARKNAAVRAAEALAEADPNGPLHQLAAKAESDARVAEAKAQIYRPTLSPQQLANAQTLPPRQGMPWWGWVAIAAGGVVATGVGYKLLRRK